MEGLKREWHTSTDLKCERVEYEIFWINSYGFNYESKWSDKKNIQHTKQNTEFQSPVDKDGSMVKEETSTRSCKAIIDMLLL